MGRTSIGDEPASLDSQTHCSLGRGLIDAASLRISRCDRGRRRHLRHRCLFGVVDKRQAAMVLDLPKASCPIHTPAAQHDAHDAPAEGCRG
jgi:hypothetical protein